MTEFGSFDNSTCKRVLDLLKPGDLTLGQVVIKRVAVVELGVNNGSGDKIHNIDKKQLRNAYYKITLNFLFEYQCTSGKFIRLPNRIESKLILPELECSSQRHKRRKRFDNRTSNL